MNKINKLFFTSALVICSSSFANAQVSNKNFVGPSVEVGTQFKNLDVKSEDFIFTDEANTLGRLAFNYGLPSSDRTVIALGASYTAGKSRASISNYYGNLNVVYDNMYALYVAPTYVVNETTAIFAKGSYNKADASLSYSSFIDDIETIKKNINGFGYGIGITTFISKDVFLKAEIEQVNYGSFGDIKTKHTNSTIAVGVKF
jgi:opacity protein-like surface antigen